MNIFMSEKYIFFKTGRGDLMAPNNFRGIVNKMTACTEENITILKVCTEG